MSKTQKLGKKEVEENWCQEAKIKINSFNQLKIKAAAINIHGWCN